MTDVDAETAQRGAAARRLMRGRRHAAFATLSAGRPYVSLVATAWECDATPLLLLSDLAQHTQNLLADANVALLFEDAGDAPDRLAAARLTLLGRAERCEEPRAMARFAARHPTSAAYAGFADFHLYRIVVERGHLVAGFGRIAWIDGADLRCPAGTADFTAAEAAILAQLNADAPDLVARLVRRRLRRRGADWRVTGIDPEGLDLGRPAAAGGATARLDFAAPVATPEAARLALAGLAGGPSRR